MALQINLYHEVLRAKKQEQYDPLRLSMIGLIVITAGLAMFYLVQLTRKSSVQGTYNQTKAEFERLTPRAKEAKQQEEQLSKQLALAERFRKRIEDRFYWAPVFEQVITAVPVNVQLTKYAGEVTNDHQRKCQMTIDGLAAGDEPRRVAEELRVALAEKFGAKFKNVSASFKSLDDGNEKVNFNGRRLATAFFSIHITFTAASAGETAPAPKQLAQKN